MCPVVRISDQLYTRLGSHAKGFDTPAAVIERLLDEYEGVAETEDPSPNTNMMPKPKLVFHPGDEKKFLQRLVQNGAAWGYIYKQDGSVEPFNWYANRMTINSNLRANIWSGRLRGWKQEGITKAEFFIDPKDLPK